MSAHADVDLFVGGQPLAGLGVKAGAFSLQEIMGGHASFSLECMALDEGIVGAVSGSQPQLDALFKQIGKEFKITLLSPDRLATRHTLTFTGIIMDVRANRQRGGGYRVILEGYSRSILMDLAAKIASIPEDGMGTLKNIFDQKGKTYGDLLALNIPDAEPVPQGMFQYFETDFDFLMRLAERHLVWCFFDGARLHFDTQLPDQEVELTMGPTRFENALDTLEMSGGVTQGSFNLSTFDSQKREAYFKTSDGMASPGDLHPWADRSRQAFNEIHLRNGDLLAEFRMRSLSEVETQITNRFKSWTGNLVHVHGTSSNADVRIAKRLKITGMADTQNGKYVLTRVSHTLDVVTGTYSNDFEAVPLAGAFPAFSRRRQPAFAIFPAVVVDKDGGAWTNERMGQVKVSPFANNPTAHIWARVVQPYAGAESGFFTMPELGDEVLVGFEEGDPTRPIVIGSVYNKNQSKLFDKLKELDKNMGKGFLTKAGNKILIQDEKDKESILISSPDEKNFVKLSLDGGAHIRVQTNGHLNLHAGGSISITAGGDINIEAGGELDTHSKKETNIESDDDINVDTPHTCSINGDEEVEITSGASTVDLTPESIEETAVQIKLN